MKRALLLIAAVAIGIVGLIQVGPPPTEPPDFGGTDDTLPDGAVASPSVWYCPWVEAGDVVDSDIVFATEPNIDVDITLLDPLANADPSTASTSVVGPGAGVVSTGDILRVGESPAIVEISDGPAAASSVQFSDAFISADQCLVSAPKIWYLTGGSTRTGTLTQIRLFNPFADNAEVSITGYSEFNLDLVPDLQSIDVPGRSWTTVDFEQYLPFRDELSLTVTATQGIVIPAMIRIDDRGEAMWPGTAPAETWEFPVATAGGLEPFVSVMSAGDDGVIVTLDIVTESGTISNAREVVIDSSAPALIPVSDLAAAPYGIRVRATAPIAAAVVATVPVVEEEGGEGEGAVGETTTTTETSSEEFVRGLAGTVGSARPSSEWIVPLDSLPGSRTTLWVMNTGTEPAQLSFSPLSEVEYAVNDSAVVEAGSVLGIPVDVGIGIFGYRISADRPITVAWSIEGDRGVALAAGIPI